MNLLEDLCRLCANKLDRLLSYNVLAPGHSELLKKISQCLPITVIIAISMVLKVVITCVSRWLKRTAFLNTSALTAPSSSTSCSSFT